MPCTATQCVGYPMAFYVAVWALARTYRWCTSADTISTRRLGTDPVVDVHCLGTDVVEVIFDEFFGGAAEYDSSKPREENNFTTPAQPHSYLKYGLTLPLPPRAGGNANAPALILDVGANIGLFSISVVQRCKQAVFNAVVARKASPATDAQQRPLHIVAFEPIPTTSLCASRNLRAFLWAPKQLPLQYPASETVHPDVRVQLVRQGIADTTATTRFTCPPTFSAGATLARKEVMAEADRRPLETISAALNDFLNFMYSSKRRAEMRDKVDAAAAEMNPVAAVVYRGLKKLHDLWSFGVCRNTMALLASALTAPYGLRYVLTVFFLPVLLAVLAYCIGAAPGEISVDCALSPLPDAIKAAGVVFADEPEAATADVVYDCVDFLKIDVEGAEEMVVKGILGPGLDGSNAPGLALMRRVRQCVVEVHDTPDHRVDRLAKALREAAGFTHVHVDVEPLHLHKIAKIATIFARRE